MVGVQNKQRQAFYARYTELLSEVINGKPKEVREDSVQVITQPLISTDYKRRFDQLHQGIEALQEKINQLRDTAHDEQNVKTPSVEVEAAPAQHCEEDVTLQASYEGRACLLVLLPLITSSMHNARFAEAKMAAISLLADLTQCLDDSVILQRVLPFLVNVLTEANDGQFVKSETEYASVMSLAIRAITAVLKNIHSLPHSDFNLVTDYVLPAIARVQQK